MPIFKVFFRVSWNIFLSQAVPTIFFYLWQTWITQLILAISLSFLPLIWKDSVGNMHGLAVYVKEGLPFAPDLSLENSWGFLYGFTTRLLHSVFYFFFLYWSPSLCLCTVFDVIPSNMNEVLPINPSYNVFFLGNFN